ncbi:MAG: hypothetical protein ACI8UO_003818 [Verrucomicrobiales bacterium]
MSEVIAFTHFDPGVIDVKFVYSSWETRRDRSRAGFIERDLSDEPDLRLNRSPFDDRRFNPRQLLRVGRHRKLTRSATLRAEL